MQKSVLILLSLGLSACSESYPTYLEHNKTRLSYTNIELNLPAQLFPDVPGGYNLVSKDKEFMLAVVFNNSGFTALRDRAINRKRGAALIKLASLVGYARDSFEEHDRFENHQTLTYAKRYGEDGAIIIGFLIDSDNEETHKKRAGIARASLETLSVLPIPVDFTEGLPYSIGAIEGMHLSSRANDVTAYEKHAVTITVSRLDNTYSGEDLNYINLAEAYRWDLKCQDMITQSTHHALTSKQQVSIKLQSQTCGDETYKAYITKIPQNEQQYFLVKLLLPRDANHEKHTAFYTDFINAFSLKTAEEPT